MLVLLPERGDGLSKLEESLSGRQARRLAEDPRAGRSAGVPAAVQAQLAIQPERHALRPGHDASLYRQGRLSGIDGRRDLYISAVVHKAYVDVNERGTEAAAATGIAMKALAMRCRRPGSAPITLSCFSSAMTSWAAFCFWPDGGSAALREPADGRKTDTKPGLGAAGRPIYDTVSFSRPTQQSVIVVSFKPRGGIRPS